MSHFKERKEKNCLNCGAQVQGMYCHICGQANVETDETLWDLIQHFVYDITHFDGKFFSTLKLLLFKPGFLSKEYVRGRRNSYLNPIRMYIFTSALFFLIFFAIRSADDMVKMDGPGGIRANRERMMAGLAMETNPQKRALYLDSLKWLDSTQIYLETVNLVPRDTTISDSLRQQLLPALQDSVARSNVVGIGTKLPSTVVAYDDQQRALPASQRDGWFSHYVKRKAIQLNEKFRYRQGEMVKSVAEKFLHSLPKMMFISLPIMAGLLMLLYIRHKRFHYVSHGILVIHVYIALYILILVATLLAELKDSTGWRFWNLPAIVLILYMFYYQYKSLRNFYEQSRGKTILKFMILFFASSILFSLLAVIFVINSLLQV